MKITDDDLNNYIDNNLSSNELEKLNENLLGNNNDFEKLKGLKSVDNILKSLEPETTSENFTNRIMQKIHVSKNKKAAKNNYFFISVISLLVTTILAFISYGILTSNHSFQLTNNSEMLSQILSSITKYYNKLSSILISTTNQDVFGSVVLIIILAFCFILFSHNKFMNKLDTAES